MLRWIIVLRCFVVVVVFGTILAAGLAQAYGPAVVDQEYLWQMGIGGLWNADLLKPVGQEFTPSLNAIDFAEVYLEGSQYPDTGVVQIRIHEKTITGSVLGTSDSVEIPPNYKGFTRFVFPMFVPLKPGIVYVLEVVALQGQNVMVEWHQPYAYEPQYAGGRAVVLGAPLDRIYLTFREGIDHSIAASKDECKADSWSARVRADGTGFKNQGDCIQYINTGM